jgi:UDP-N-acetylmuramate--alanine ligase
MIPFGRIHVVGASGTGMSALAELLLSTGRAVSGSDRFLDAGRITGTLATLEKEGVKLFPQDGSGVSGADAIAISSAIESDNPDLVAAHAQGIPVFHRAELLAKLADEAGAEVIGVAGTCGKTTTTGMLGEALEKLGADPTVVAGGALVDWEAGGTRLGNVRPGGKLWVLELDESDRSFLRFSPAKSIVTNLAEDHFSLDETKALFREFAGKVAGEIVCSQGVPAPLGFAADGTRWREAVGTPAADGRGGLWRGTELVSGGPGVHNFFDAMLAGEMCLALGFGLAETVSALAAFGGMRRRMERVGELVWDDYAHNPDKVRNAMSAAKLSAPRLGVVFRPHGYGPLRKGLAGFAASFAASLGEGDALWILPVFDAGGTAQRDISSADLAAAAKAAGCRAEIQTVENHDEARRAAAAFLRSGGGVLVMGARDPDLPLLAHSIAADGTSS